MQVLQAYLAPTLTSQSLALTPSILTHHLTPLVFITGLQTALDGKVDDSQVLTNVPSGALFTDTVYTLPFTDNSANWNTAYGWGDHSTESYATETYVGDQITALVDSSPATMDTLNELAAALGDDPNFATTVSNSIGTKWTQDNTKISQWNTAYGWGNHASAGYYSASNPNGYTNDQTAAEILTAIKTVGGSGSGLDADLLDGYQKADLNPAHSHYRWTNISASGAQARRFVIMRLYASPAHWDSNWQDIHLKVWSETYEATNLKYEICGDYNGGNQNTMFQLRLKGRWRFFRAPKI